MIEEFNKDVGINWTLVVIHGALALVSGGMKELHKVQNKGFIFKVFVANAAVSSLVGIIFFFLLAGFELPTYLCAAFTGIAGWMGGNLMDFLGLLLKKGVTNKLGTTVTVEEEKAHSELINNKQ